METNKTNMNKIAIIITCLFLFSGLAIAVDQPTPRPVSDQVKVDQETKKAKEAAEKRADFERRKREYIESMRKAEREAKETRTKEKKSEVPQK